MFLEKFKELISMEKNKHTIKELSEHFGKSSFTVMLILITFVTSLPLPPWGGGIETIPGGILSIFLALQALIGMDRVFLPNFIQNITVDIEIVKTSEYTEKIINWIENNIQPGRYKWALNPFNEKLMYLLVIPNALLMIIPIVFTNGPPSQCITLMSLCWLLHDGMYFLIMLVLSVVVFILYIILFYTFAKLLYRTRRTWTFGFWK